MPPAEPLLPNISQHLLIEHMVIEFHVIQLLNDAHYYLLCQNLKMELNILILFFSWRTRKFFRMNFFCENFLRFNPIFKNKIRNFLFNSLILRKLGLEWYNLAMNSSNTSDISIVFFLLILWHFEEVRIWESVFN